MKTSTRSPRRRSCRSSRRRSQQSRERYSKSIGEARLMIGNCDPHDGRAPKSRAGCHFAAAIGLRSMLEDFAPAIPDWANDQHTLPGKQLGRGLDHFRKEGAKLVPPPTAETLRGRSLSAVGDQAAGQGTARAGLDVNEPKRFCASSRGATICPVLDGNRKKSTLARNDPNDPQGQRKLGYK